EKKIEEKVEKETEKTMDSILNPNDKSSKKDTPKETSKNPETNPDVNGPKENVPSKEDLKIFSKFDYVPGDKLIFFDDFSQDFIGDFPSKWNTNGSGEVVRFNIVDGNWFEFKPGYAIYYIPLINTNLPEEYTIEFDLLSEGLDRQTSSTAKLTVTLDDNDSFKYGRNYAYAEIPFGQYGAFGIRIRNLIDGKNIINSVVTADVRDEVKNKPHVSIAVNKKRFRLWINEIKYIDVPQMIPDGQVLTHLKFNLSSSFKDGKERLFIKNLKIAEGGVDLRRTLMTEGKVSTNGILFDSGSAKIQPQSYGIIRQISQVLLQDESMKLNIVGHTDADGDDDTNLKLSKARADAVKNALITIYNISGDRLQTDGKGESEAVGDNTTSTGKAQNRRVEFIKM
ncbi:OmpA family protein, partial [Flavobacteriaceae bacterium AH-315-B10]|nr:OmpA family protein [Flavobacteriaceae bacterium AH-315-B10]